MIERMFVFGKLFRQPVIFWFHDVQVPVFFQIMVPQSHTVLFLLMKYCEKQKQCIYIQQPGKGEKKKVFLRHLWHEKGDVFSGSWPGFTEVLSCSVFSLQLTETRHDCLVKGFLNSCILFPHLHCYRHIEMHRYMCISVHL